MNIPPSSLDIFCPRYHFLLGERPDIPPDEHSRFGVEAEEAVVDALATHQPSYTLPDGTVVSIPTELQELALEVQKEIKYEILPGVWVHGFIDLYAPATNVVIDVKSSYSTSTGHWKWQVSAYTWAFKTTTADGITAPAQGAIYFARHGVLVPIPAVTWERLVRRCKKVMEWKTARQEPRPTPNWFCQWCVFAPTCPQEPEVIHRMKESPGAVLAELIKVKAAYEGLQTAVKTYCAEIGRLESDAGIAEFTPTSRLEVSPEFWETLTRLGIDIKTVVNPDRKKVMNLAREFPEIANLVSLVPGGTRFVVRANENQEEEE